MDREEALPILRAINGSPRWVERLVHSRPFEDASALQRLAERVWWSLSEQDWLDAFAAHPRIGQPIEGAAQPAEGAAQRVEGTAPRGSGADQHAAWSEMEQRDTASAPAELRARLAALNDRYAAKFGFIYIVCASGRSADELLALLEARIDRSRAEELRTAAEEQARITRLRIEKWLAQP